MSRSQQPANGAPFPHWPYRMRAELAAAFCGFVNGAGQPIVNSFAEWLKRTSGPEGWQDRTNDGKTLRNRYWYRDELERHLDLQRGSAPCSGQEEEDPFLKASREARGEDGSSVSH